MLERELEGRLEDLGHNSVDDILRRPCFTVVSRITHLRTFYERASEAKLHAAGRRGSGRLLAVLEGHGGWESLHRKHPTAVSAGMLVQELLRAQGTLRSTLTRAQDACTRAGNTSGEASGLRLELPALALTCGAGRGDHWLSSASSDYAVKGLRFLDL